MKKLRFTWKLNKRIEVTPINPQTYKNVTELSYGELLSALSRLKSNMSNIDMDNPKNPDNNYYKALVTELDKRQKDIL